jgi:hypothetical protein
MVVLVTSLAVKAQNWGGGQQMSTEERARTFVQRMGEKVPFPKSKTDSLVTVFKSFYEDMQTYRTEGNKEVIQALSQKRDNNVKGVLANDEQYAAYVKYMEDMKAQRQQQRQQNGNDGGGHRGGGRRPGGYGGGGGFGGMRQPGF